MAEPIFNKYKGQMPSRRPAKWGVPLAVLVLASAVICYQVTNRNKWQEISRGTYGGFSGLSIQNKKGHQPIGVGTCQLSGTVSDSHCDYESVEQVNSEHLLPLLSELARKPFFRYFKVNLYCDCPFWPDDGMCSLRDCSVCECDNKEVPQAWLAADGRLPTPDCEAGAGALEEESAVDRSVEPGMKQQLQGIPGWRGMNNPWMPEDDADVDFSYINLLENVERYTGYKVRHLAISYRALVTALLPLGCTRGVLQGEHPNRIWKLIYSQSCFRDIDSLTACPEKRIFYRLISGMHASISAHIVDDYLMDEARGIWGPNLPAFQERLGNEAAKNRVENLYFTFLFVLRAVMKAGPLLENVSYSTGVPTEDARTLQLVQQLVQSKALRAACPVPFDEGRLWKSEGSALLKLQLQKHFQNMTKAMDCVGCEKCKLWGKLQLLGIATSLKILFSSESCGAEAQEPPRLQLERNEVIALVNLLERLSKAINIVTNMSLQLTTASASAGSAVEELTKHPLQQSI